MPAAHVPSGNPTEIVNTQSRQACLIARPLPATAEVFHALAVCTGKQIVVGFLSLNVTGVIIPERGEGSSPQAPSFFIGPPGSGKSHSAQAIGQAVIQQGHRVLYRETHTLLDELAEATLDGTRKERMEFLETVPADHQRSGHAQTAIDCSRGTAGNHHAALRTGQHNPDLESPHRGLGKTVGRHRCRRYHARPSSSPRACAQVRSAQLENQNRIVFYGTTKSKRNEANRWRTLMRTPVFVKYQSTSVEQTEEAKPVNLGPQIANAHGVTSPQRDFV